MKHLHRKEWIAVAVSLAFLTYVFYAEALLNLFDLSMDQGSVQGAQSGVVVEEVSLGTGAIAEPGDTITAHYVGRLTDGRVFDSSRDRGMPITFTLGVGQVIRGWDEGLQGMREGGVRTLIISPDFGYGDRAAGPIPPNSTLTFEVELVGVEKPAATTPAQ